VVSKRGKLLLHFLIVVVIYIINSRINFKSPHLFIDPAILNSVQFLEKDLSAVVGVPLSQCAAAAPTTEA